MATGVEIDLAPIVRLQTKGLVNREAALNEIGLFMVSEAQQAFRRGGWRGGKKWKRRRVPNIAGIIRDMEKGGTTLKKRRMQPSPVLIDSGRLRGSIAMRVRLQEGSVIVGTNVRYAQDHQRGRKVILPGASLAHRDIRTNLAKLLRSEKTTRPELREQLGWLFNVDNWTLKLPKRPIMEVNPVILRDINAIILRHRMFPEERA